jgi:hypothetical protein
MCRSIFLSCVLFLVFHSNVYFVNGILVTCVPVASVCGLCNTGDTKADNGSHALYTVLIVS